MKILVAEDDLASRTLLAEMLKKWGYAPVVAADGESALEVLRQKNYPSLAILDWVMPKMDGLEVVHRIRKIETKRPPYILLLTIKQEKKNIVTALEAGADDYIGKPFDPAELRARIQVGRRLVETQERLLEKMKELEQAASEIKTLRGILPICMICKQIRDDKGYWNQIESYIHKHSEVEFSHSICKDCVKIYYPDMDLHDD